MTELTREQAVALYHSNFWVDMSPRQIAEFQLSTPWLCMPFDVFQKAVETTLGRSVWTHEFADQKQLLTELYGDRPAPTFAEILEMIPEGKRVLVVT